MFRRRSRWVVGLALVLVGCGTSKPGADAVSKDPIASCETFTLRSAGCQAKLGASPDVAAQRSATTRETLRVQTEAAKTEADRAVLDAQCAAGLKQLDAVCP